VSKARLEVDDRDFPPAWHLKTLAIVAVVVFAAVAIAWKVFL
jgi:hypothetical protein